MWKLLICLRHPEIQANEGCSRGLPSALPSASFCLPATGPVDSGVTLTPKYVIKSRQQQETLRCSPVSGHLSVSWYQQALGQGHQFPAEYYRGEERGEGNILDRFSGQQFSDSSSEPDLSSLELTEAALYLCASSQFSALHDQLPLVQKHSCPSSGSGCEGVDCQPTTPRPW